MNCMKSTAVNKVAAMKSTDDFCHAKEAITCNHKINTFTVSKDGWNTKLDTVKFLKNALECFDMPKGISRTKATSNVEKLSP